MEDRLAGLGFESNVATEVLAVLPSEAIAVLLYGSRARGDVHAHSDVDILVVAERFGRTRAEGVVNVSTYSRDQMLSASGTLFGTHLARDGVILHDANGWLAGSLSEFRPTEPRQVLARVRDISVILGSSETSRDRYIEGLVRLARYLLRTALYAKALDPGPPCFSIAGLAERFGQPELRTLLSSHVAVHAVASLAVLIDLEARISEVVGPIDENPYATLQALIVAEWDSNRDVANAALLALSSDRTELPYAEIPRIVL